MSIYATWLDLDEETPGVRGPIVYRGSHIMPSDDDPRDGTVDVSGIAGFISHNGRTLGDDLTYLVWPWLRLTVNDATVVLDRDQVAAMHKTLGEWLKRCPEPDTGAAPTSARVTPGAANANGGAWGAPQPSAAEQPPGAPYSRPGAVPQVQ